MIKKKYYKDSYMGYSIKCDSNYPCYLGILSKLLEISQAGQQSFVRPIGFHVRYRLKGSVDGRAVTDRLNKYYQNPNGHRNQANTFKPYWLKVNELDLAQDGYHQHLAVIIDGKKATRASLHHFFASLKDKYFKNYRIIEPWDSSYRAGVDLKTEKGMSYYIHWMSYIAKVNTKDFIPQTYSACRLG